MEEHKPEDKEKVSVGALVLAAGYSSRMGAFKPLLPIGDKPAIERVLDTLDQAGIPVPLVVTGYNKEALEPFLGGKQVRYVFNKDFSEGMFTSIKKGIDKLISEPPGEYTGFLLMLSDCPLVSPRVLEMLMEKHRENPHAFIAPCYKGKKGHPLLIPIIHAEEILSYKGEGGLKAITSRYDHELIRLEVGDETVLLDMDTPAGYTEVLDYYEKSKKGSAEKECEWRELLAGRRLFLVRHGQIRQHREKIFLGQADIPLSEKGRHQAKLAARKIRSCSLVNPVIHASDLDRTVETAKIISHYFEKPTPIPCNYHEDLREMSLGEWDGKYIREIKDTYPEEYGKRGESILTYKFDHESENFYDLQYRVMKAFRKIVEEENALGLHQDLIIVAHTGVIKVLLSNLYNKDLSKEMSRIIPNGDVIPVCLSRERRNIE